MDITRHGQIELLSLPDGWSEITNLKRVDIGGRGERRFSPAENSAVGVYLFYRGFPLSVNDGKAFTNVLVKPPHSLLGSETSSVAAVLGQRANSDSFTVLSLRTEDLSGRRVLVLEGRYKASNLDIYEIFIDADGSGQAVQEIYLLAPKDQFLLYARTFKECLSTLRWKA